MSQERVPTGPTGPSAPTGPGGAAGPPGGRFSESVYAELREIGARYPQARSGLLPMLHLVQSIEGRVTARGIEACAEVLDISAAEVAGVATFYTMYKRRPVGDYHVGVCTNTLCAIMGGDAIFERLCDHLGVGNDETTPDDGTGPTVTLEHLECNAACDYAPVMMVNWEFMDNMTPQSATALVDDLRSGGEVRSTRGPVVCTWREAERVLAGFPDDRADEGPAGGEPTMAGLRLARDNGWRAPGQTGQAQQTQQSQSTQESAGDVSDKKGAAERADTARAEAETEVEKQLGEEKGQEE